MIRQVDSNNFNKNQQHPNSTPHFKGIEALGGTVLNGATGVIQYLESQPMINVAAIDLSTAIIPRTIVEAQTNPYAGMEAFRRESSGLIINCMIPGVIVAGLALPLQRLIMGKNSNMSKCWANESTIELITNEWAKAPDVAGDLFKDCTNPELAKKSYNTLYSIINKASGSDGHSQVNLKADEVKESLVDISKQISGEKYAKNEQKEVLKAFNKIADKFHIARHVEINGKHHGQSFNQIFENAPYIFRELDKGLLNGKSAAEVAKEFGKKATKLVRFKSIAGLGIILPLALAAQPINRWLTAKTSGTKGAPIYNDFTKAKNRELSIKEKTELSKQKIISVGAMIGVALLSIGKKPNKEMFKNISQFSEIFPTMDQARIISTATFTSRMLSSEDKNDLREATVRDIATFSAFYFLGDYVAKAFATVLEKTVCKDKGISLINRLKDYSVGDNIGSKLVNWVKNTTLKSTAEVYGPTEKLTKYAKNLRAACQIGSIGFSLLALGLVIPIWNRHITKKKHEAELEKSKLVQNASNPQEPNIHS